MQYSGGHLPQVDLEDGLRTAPRRPIRSEPDSGRRPCFNSPSPGHRSGVVQIVPCQTGTDLRREMVGH
jgi:hypothetical protein